MFYIALLFNNSTLTAYTQPLIASSKIMNGHKIFSDKKKGNLYYYVPFDYKLVVDKDGRPEFSLIQMRYTGTHVSADAGVAKYNNLLQFRVAVDAMQQKEITKLKELLKKKQSNAELRQLPVKKFSSVLVFARSSELNTPDSGYVIRNSYSEMTDESTSVNNSYWTDRIITFRLNNIDAELVEAALKNHGSLMSFSYAMYSAFSESGLKDAYVNGDKDIDKRVKDFFTSEAENKKDSAAHLLLVKANAINLNVDIDAWPSIVQKIDINEKVPARYPLFDVYCYDFNNDLRPDLYSKKIEIKAASVNGSSITSVITFRQSQPDIYAKSLRFIYAARFDKPFYYRVTEVNNEGESVTFEWNEKKNWSELIDITSSPEKVVQKTAKNED